MEGTEKSQKWQWKEKPDFAIQAGDMVQVGSQLHWERFWRKIATASDPVNPGVPFASNLPYFLAVGNHEIYNSKDEYGVYVDNTTAIERFPAYTDNPPNNSSNPAWEERYYSFTYGCATFIVLDTNNTSDDFFDNSTYYPDGVTPDWEPESEQYKWMVEELKKAQKNSVFTFIVMHPSPYCRADHGDPKDKLSSYKIRALDGTFRAYGVDAVLASHDHLYERCLTGPDGFWEEMDEKDVNNLNYFVMGNSGQASRVPVEGWETWMDITGNDGPPYYTKYFYEWAGQDELASHLSVNIEKENEKDWKCTFKIIRTDGEVFDEFYIEREDPLYEQNSLYTEPYLQNVQENGITVQWWTVEETEDNYVKYGPSLEYKEQAGTEYVPSMGKYLHQAKITGLKKGTEYKYKVASDSIESREYSFKTAPDKFTDIHFAILGDGRTDNMEVLGRHRKITDLAWNSNIDFIMEIGDEVCTGETIHWWRFLRQLATATDEDFPGPPIASHIPYYLAIGNHEIYVPRGDGLLEGYGEGNLTTSMENFIACTDNPPNNSRNPLWEERFYSFTYGPATFIVLDTNNTSDDFYDNHDYLPDKSTPDWEPESEQYLWMIEELKKAQENSIFTFICMHPSPYTRGTHGNPEEVQSGWHLRALDEVFRQYGVDGVLASHDHLIERCLTGPAGYWEEMDEKDVNNLNYFVIGNSGHSSRGAKENWETWMDIKGNDGPPYYTKYFYDWEKTDHSSYLDVKIEKESEKLWKCTFKIIRDDGEIFDEFYIERRYD